MDNYLDSHRGEGEFESTPIKEFPSAKHPRLFVSAKISELLPFTENIRVSEKNGSEITLFLSSLVTATRLVSKVDNSSNPDSFAKIEVSGDSPIIGIRKIKIK